MTFEDWRSTRNQATLGLEKDILEDNFGYVPENVLTVYVYEPCGVLCSLKNGRYFTLVRQEQYTGTLEAVERRLWDDYAKQEVG